MQAEEMKLNDACSTEPWNLIMTTRRKFRHLDQYHEKTLWPFPWQWLCMYVSAWRFQGRVAYTGVVIVMWGPYFFPCMCVCDVCVCVYVRACACNFDNSEEGLWILVYAIIFWKNYRLKTSHLSKLTPLECTPIPEAFQTFQFDRKRQVAPRGVLSVNTEFESLWGLFGAMKLGDKLALKIKGK